MSADEQQKMIKPSLGRIVLVKTHGDFGRGPEEKPAIVTQVHSATVVNVTIFGDGVPFPMTSVQHESAVPSPVRGNATWRWPPRV